MAPSHRINNRIRAKFVRVVGDNIEKSDIYPIEEAIKLADQFELDLQTDFVYWKVSFPELYPAG